MIFNSTAQINIGDLKLYGTGNFVPPITVFGDGGVGYVNGSLVWEAANNTVHWVKTGGVLAPATYTVVMSSGTTGNTFHGTGAGDALDGNANGVAGDDFVRANNLVGAPAGRIISVPDFARGQGQAVLTNSHGTQAGATGLPITINDGAGVKSVHFVLNYDPTLLSISTLAGNITIPANWSVAVNSATPGHLDILVFSTDNSDLGAGPKTVLTFTNVSVPGNAPYGAADLITFSSVLLNENLTNPIAAIADSAVHKAVDLGDATGDGTISGLDANRISQVVVTTNTGFAFAPLTDPVIIGDLTGDGTLSGLDASDAAQYSVNPGSQPQIPAPLGQGTVIAGVDPIVRTGNGASATILGAGGENVMTSVQITDSGAGLLAADLIITYDTSRLDITTADVTLSSALQSQGWILSKNVNDATGTIRVSMFSQDAALGAGPVGLVNLNFSVPLSAPAGVTTLGLTDPNGHTQNSTRLNEGGLVITTDLGTITVPTLGDWDLDGQRTEADIPAMLSALTDLPHYKSQHGLSDAQLLAIGDTNHDNVVSNRDLQGMLDLVIADEMGPGSGSGSGSSEGSVAPAVVTATASGTSHGTVTADTAVAPIAPAANSSSTGPSVATSTDTATNCVAIATADLSADSSSDALVAPLASTPSTSDTATRPASFVAGMTVLDFGSTIVTGIDVSARHDWWTRHAGNCRFEFGDRRLLCSAT